MLNNTIAFAKRDFYNTNRDCGHWVWKRICIVNKNVLEFV